MHPDEWRALLVERGMRAFRADQILQALYRDWIQSWDEATTLPKDLRADLAREFPLVVPKVLASERADDGTTKLLLGLADGNSVETVVIPAGTAKSSDGRPGRLTQCISSQVGCAMGCAFCASTIGGFKRRLTAGEMLSEVYLAQKETGERISHIVLMGMGEPLDNFDNVMRFLLLVTDENGLNISMRNVSLSTCGLVPEIRKLMEKHLQLTLSISLHAPNNEIRNKIMPVNSRYPVEELLGVCREYTLKTSRRISFEYSMLSGVNDSDECARELASKLKGMLCHVNLIPVNEVDGSPFRPSSPERVKKFTEILEKNGINATVRRKLGSDIDASCGQLRLKEKKKGELI